MDLTEILLRFWGTLLLISLMALVLNKELLPKLLQMVEKDEYLFLSGFIALLIGAFHVAIYNYWELSSRGLITLFGYLALIKGAVRLSAPDFSHKMISNVVKNSLVYYSLLLLLGGIGLYFTYIGYFS